MAAGNHDWDWPEGLIRELVVGAGERGEFKVSGFPKQ